MVTTRTTASVRRFSAVLAAAVLALSAAGCGDSAAPRPSADQTSPSPTEGLGRESGDWLLRFTTAGGEDGEKEGSIYVRFDPSTGAAVARTLPALHASDAGEGEQPLLVSADHQRAIQDTAVPPDQARTGRLVLYSLTGNTTQTLDIRAASGDPRMRAVAWAFDPSDGNVLRVVDSHLGVWKVDLAAQRATKESQLQQRDGWIYGNGFDPSTGQPYIESIDSDQTAPAGNGDSDVRPVTRQGGTILPYDGEKLAGLPTPPCGLATVFRFDDGDAWVFCGDDGGVTAYRLADGSGDGTWAATGTPSPKVLPGQVAGVSFALPPVG